MIEEAARYPARPAETSVPIHEPLALRWSPRRLDASATVSPRELRALLEAARWAPSSGNEQPWRFLVIPRDHPLRGELQDTLTLGNAWATRASVLIATLAKQTRAKNNEPNRWAEHDTGIATACLIVQAASMGLVTHPMGGFDAGALARSFGVPDEYTPMAVIAVGRYDPALQDPKLEEREAKPRTRKPLSEIAFLGGFGEPLSD